MVKYRELASLSGDCLAVFVPVDAIPCSDGLCKNGLCSDVANASFSCQCEPGYYGVLCETGKFDLQQQPT